MAAKNFFNEVALLEYTGNGKETFWVRLQSVHVACKHNDQR